MVNSLCWDETDFWMKMSSSKPHPSPKGICFDSDGVSELEVGAFAADEASVTRLGAMGLK